jgi:hypothetical protein
MIGFTKSEELHDRAGAEAAFRRVIEGVPGVGLRSRRGGCLLRKEPQRRTSTVPVDSAGAGKASP